MCEADERNRRALFEIGRQRTADAISLRRIEHILRGPECECQPETTDQEKSPTAR